MDWLFELGATGKAKVEATGLAKSTLAQTLFALSFSLLPCGEPACDGHHKRGLYSKPLPAIARFSSTSSRLGFITGSLKALSLL
jgi:hypothetical protein